MINPESILVGRTLALDRSALPGLLSRAELQLGGASLKDLAEMRAGLNSNTTRVSFEHVGGTAIVPLTGMISPDPVMAWVFGGTSPDVLVRTLQAAIADPSVTNILLLVDSPGGEVALIPETAAKIRELGRIKPIVSVARCTMASGAYWLAAQAGRVIATPSANVGSVGVFTMHEDQSRRLDTIGITVTYIASDPKKVEGNKNEPLATDAKAFLQLRVDALYGAFVRDLSAGRHIPEARVRSQYGAGRVFSAAEAQSRGLVDQVATLDAVLLNSGSGVSVSAGRLSAADSDALAIMAALSEI